MSLGGNGRVAWVTGASGGLGRALAEAFLGAGWRVIAAGHRDLPALDSPDLWRCRLDVREAEAVTDLAGEIERRWGRLDVLVCNAGIARDGLVVQAADEAWDEVLDVNLKGAFLCARAALGPMLRQGAGHILNIASFSGRVGSAGQASYAASKAGLVGLTLSLAREVGPQGVCVNAILPGALLTGMTRGLGEEHWRRYREASVLGRINDPGEVARLIVELAGCRHISGQVLALDGRVAPWT